MEPEPAQPVPEPDPRAAFETFWSDNYRPCLAHLVTMGATLDDAHDAIGDVIVKMLADDTLERLTNPGAWVRKAVCHRYIDRQKRERQRPEREISGQAAGSSYLDDDLNVWEDWQWVQQTLSALPPAQRSILELVIAELGTKEIAELLGKTPDAVRQNLAHARKRLRTNLGEHRLIEPVKRPATNRRKEGTR